MSQTISFYSYKGGVGRSLALANVAALLATRGKRVVCIDFDIEAGGLHTIFGLEASKITYSLLDTLLSAGLPSVVNAVMDLTAKLPRPHPDGKLLLVPAVSEVSKVNKIVENARDMPMLLGEIISQLEDLYLPHYVLLDSRSGFAELAAAPLRRAQSLVCVLRPNRQNMDGLRLLLDILVSMRKPPNTLLVLSQVPDDPAVAPRLASLESLLGPGRKFDVTVPYSAELALEETVAAIETPDSALVRHYDEIVDWIEKAGNN